MKILIVEDNVAVLTNIFAYLESKNYILDAAYDAEMAHHLCAKSHYDVLVVDWMLPKMQGVDLIQNLREKGIEAPIIMLTAKNELEDKLQGFAVGADDYLTKPFSIKELEARILALHKLYVGRQDILQVADLKYDLKLGQVIRNGQIIQLHPSIQKILALLMRESPNIVSRERLEQMLWGDNLPEKDILRTHIYELRKKIDAEHSIKLLKTIPKVGYQISFQNS